MSTDTRSTDSVRIRIYPRYDRDLVALYYAQDFSLTNAMKQALRYFARGKMLRMEVPYLPTLAEVHPPQEIGFFISLHPQKDKEIIEFLDKYIPLGVRNSFTKNLLRSCLAVPALSLYMLTSGPEWVARIQRDGRYGQYPIQRAIIDPVDLAEGELEVTVQEDEDEQKVPSALAAGRRGDDIQKDDGAQDEYEDSEKDLKTVSKEFFAKAEKKKQQKINETKERINKKAQSQKQQVKPSEEDPIKKQQAEERKKIDDETDAWLDSIM